MLELIALLITIIGALGATGLFLYAVWKLARSIEFRERVLALAKALGLSREEINPILKPTQYDWEREAVMNPGVVKVGDRVHLFYRAIGADGVSRIGYASSKDGVHFDDRLPYPIFALDAPDPRMRAHSEHYMKERFPQLVASGGSWSGVEDPRAVVIDDRLHLTFTAFGGWDSLRIGTTSISLDDLLHKRWNWSRPTFLSPRGQVHKNWVLFPEKINGKFAVLHSLHSGSRDRVLVDYLDTLSEHDANIESPYNPSTDPEAWDSTLRGAGPPPLKTERGWLVLYHAIDAREPSRYKLGALLLDLQDPTKVIARGSAPLLAPDARYENEGAKSGIVYASGAFIADGLLRVYYGGADTVVCAAKIGVKSFMKNLAAPHPAHPSAPRLALI